MFKGVKKLMKNLERFVGAQANQDRGYKIALSEMKAGRKENHWIWYIFPQLKELGYSDNAKLYGIENLDEAKKYLAHPILGKRLIEITEVILNLSKDDPIALMDDEIDATKLKSSMTLFALASGEKTSVFHKAIEKFFGGKMDEKTLKLIN